MWRIIEYTKDMAGKTQSEKKMYKVSKENDSVDINSEY